jgi:hypothetical protein
MFLLPVARALGSSLLLPSLLLYIATSYCRSPYFIRKATMQQLQAEFPEQYAATSRHRFRAGDDMQFASAYKWYAAHIWAAEHPEQQMQQQHSGSDDGEYNPDETLQFVMLADYMAYPGRNVKDEIQEAWQTLDVRFVCLNDNTNNLHYLPKINRQTVQFLSAQYPTPSEFELPEGVTNGCRYLSASYGRLPSAEEVTSACSAS